MQKGFITATPDSGTSGGTTVTVTASANVEGTTRTSSLTVSGGGVTRTVQISQVGTVYSVTYNSLGTVTYYLFNSNATPAGNPSTYSAIRSGTSVKDTWSPSPGYLVNNVSSAGADTYLNVGNTIYIRKATGSNTWDSSSPQSFTLIAGNQTVMLN